MRRPFHPVPAAFVALLAVSSTLDASGQTADGFTVIEVEPARLIVTAADDATVHIDGTFVGATPLDQTVVLEPGRHVVTVATDGAHPHTEAIELASGEVRTLTIELETTRQRVASVALLGIGGAGLAASIVFGALALVEHRASRETLAQASDDLNEFGAQSSARDDYRLASGIAVASGLVLFIAGGALYVLDDPLAPAHESVRVVPVVAPGYAAVTMTMDL